MSSRYTDDKRKRNTFFANLFNLAVHILDIERKANVDFCSQMD